MGRRRVRRLMRKLGLWAVRPKRNTSKRHPGHKVYPYLLRGKTIDRANQVWAADITYIPMRQGFLYLVAIRGTDGLHDSPLEGSGFELLVPLYINAPALAK